MTVTIDRDTDALVNLAIATRHDWREDDVRNAITDATTVGLAWPKILRRLVTLMLIADSEPSELVTAEDRRQSVADYRTHAARARAGLPRTDTP